MKHRVAGRKLGRTSAHRLALLRNLATALFERERIRTTLMKAKELRPFAEKLITLAKRETLHARRQVLRHVHDRTVVAKLFETLSARFAQRPGGYTRILKLGPRRGDAAEMALIELVGFEAVASKKKGGAKGKGAKAAPEAEAAVREGEEPAEEKPLEKSAGKKAPAKKAKETGKAKKPKAAGAKGKGKPAKPDAKAAKKPAKKGGKGSEE